MLKLLNFFMFCKPVFIRHTQYSKYSSIKAVLGIETSCDDTGCAVISGDGDILGEAINSQNLVHLRYGGINPMVAYNLHREHIEPVAVEALAKAKINYGHLDAIAVTVKPGLQLSLNVGVQFATYLSKLYHKPLVPIHHMEAHALVARMTQDIQFPFLVLLISGGHCLLSLVKDVDEFLLLGEGTDDAPGEAFDKTARRMKLRNIPEYSQLSGGQAIELAASKATNPFMFEFPLPMVKYRDCNFSMSGLKDSVLRKLLRKEAEHNILGDGVIPEVNDLCAAFQMAIAKHLVHRTQRAMKFCELRNLIPCSNRTLVVSGGVACNNFIFRALQVLADSAGYSLYRPPPKLCTDNGVMIAWNGLERFKRGIGIIEESQKLEVNHRSPLGVSLVKEVSQSNIPVKVVKLKSLFSI